MLQADALTFQAGFPKIPGRKPWPPHTARIDPNGSLSYGLVNLVLFETPASSGMRDYTGRQYTDVTGTSQVATVDPLGGFAGSTSGTSVTDNYGFKAGSTGGGTTWSLAVRCKFDGIGGGTYTGNLGLACNTAVSAGIGVNNGTNLFGSFANSFAGSTAVTSLSTWHTLMFTSDGTTETMYLDGLANGSTIAPQNFVMNFFVFGWPWPTSYLFYWNVCLSAAQVMQHFQDPIGTTMQAAMVINPRTPRKAPYIPVSNNGPMMSA
jgi:hypothetical protein